MPDMIADTALSMAKSLLVGAIGKAASAAANKMSLLMGVRKDIWFIKDELETMHAFLVAAEAMKDKDILLKVWMKQVRDLSYSIEDCLGEFMVHVASPSRSRKLMKLKDRHRIAMQIRDLKSRAEEVSSRNTRYNLIQKNHITRAIDERDYCMEDIRNQSGSNIDEAQLVGFSKPKQKLIALLDVHTNNGPARVVCVVGMGGLGKTTLTRKVYESMDNFSCCAWITVSQPFIRMKFLKDMIKEFADEKELEKRLDDKVVGDREEYLKAYLKKVHLEKRYFVVLDDLWDIEDWKWIRSNVFPSTNSKGSRIMVTTRDVGIARECALDYSRAPLIYHHKHLDTKDAIKLLLRKARKSEGDMKNDENMRKVVTKIVKKCGELPLAILTIGAMLATKAVADWEMIYNQIPLELESKKGNLEPVKRMVTLSYNHLPCHLKPCFLYLSIFLEDSEIKRRRLVERWIAEGFIITRGGLSAEDVGNNYFDELINRSMIQPIKVNLEGKVKSCRVHDIVRDVIISISRDENFACSTWDKITGITGDNFRHVAYHGSWCPNKGLDWSHVRSLTVFGERPIQPAPPPFSPEFKMLRVLDLHDSLFEVTQKDISTIGSLRHLKYVSAQFSYIYKIPRSIGKLQGLQTLDIRDSNVTSLPIEITKLQSLRSLRCSKENMKENLYLYYPMIWCMSPFWPLLFTPIFSSYARRKIMRLLHMAWTGRLSNTEGVRVPRGISNLKVLEILEVVDIERTSRKAVEELGELKNLRKLSVTLGASKEKRKILCASFKKLSSLRSLGMVATSHRSDLKWLNSASSLPTQLRTLNLSGVLGELPRCLVNLVKIYLESSNLQEGDNNMNILGSLPELMFLQLDEQSYVGNKLVFRAGTFLKLREIYISALCVLRELIFEEDTLPLLEKIEISRCLLESGITGVRHLPRLKEISLGYELQLARLAMLQSDVDTHPNGPVLRMKLDRSMHELSGDIAGGGSAAAVQVEESSLNPGGPTAEAESSSSHSHSQSQVVAVKTGSDSSQDVEDDFRSCNSDDDA